METDKQAPQSIAGPDLSGPYRLATPKGCTVNRVMKVGLSSNLWLSVRARPSLLSILRVLRTKSRQNDLIILLGVSLIFRVVIATFVSHPPYIDAAYYFDVAKSLASGHGFTEDFIFAYLAPARSVVHPSNFLWMPLTSIVIAPFFALFGTSWHVAQIPFTLLSASLPLLAYWIGWDIFQSRRYALAIAYFMLLEGPLYTLEFAVTDSFALYSWVGLLALVGMYQGWRGHPWRFALAGIAIGLAHLTRADGGILLVVGGLVWLCSHKRKDRKGNILWVSNEGTQLHPIPWQALLGMCSFYLLTMAPWFLRNLALIGSPLPTWGTATIWLTSYSDFFSFHKILSAQTYFSWGLSNILSSKLQALLYDLVVLSVALYIPLPFAILGMWSQRKRADLLPFLIYLLLLYAIMSLIFSVTTVHGTFSHSLTPLLPVLHGWAIVGMDITIAYTSKRFGKEYKNASKNANKTLYANKTFKIKGLVEVFMAIIHKKGVKGPQFSPTIPPKDGDLLCLAIAMAAGVVVLGQIVFDLPPTWRQDYFPYQKVEQIVASDYRENRKLHDPVQPVVMVPDAATYYYFTGQHAVALPEQDLSAILDAAQSYSVSYILFPQDQWEEKYHLQQTPFVDGKLKLIWTSSSGALYRFLRS